MQNATCPVCGEPAELIAYLDGGPCMSCVKARAKAAQTKRCVCSVAKRQPSEPNRYGRRTCNRCLGGIA